MGFSAGEIAIFVARDGSPTNPGDMWIKDYDGDDVYLCGSTGPGQWEVRTRNGTYFKTYEYYLRKKKPPEQLGSWDELNRLTNWHPLMETA